MSDADLAITEIFHDNIVMMQAAWIEWRRGRGAEAAMQWIENSLDGPGLIPDLEEPYATEAQAYFDLNRSRPWPACACGRPSNPHSKDWSACSVECELRAKAVSRKVDQ